MIVTRFAPSPTGRLHLGHAFSAMRAHDFARDRGGRFLLRIEDIDPGRTREAFVDGIGEDLRWLGLSWDGPVLRQSARLGLYADALAGLKARGLVYPCFCTRRDIAASTSAPHGPEGAIYPGTCRALAPDIAATRIAAGEPHAWRLDMAAAAALAGTLRWEDHGCAITAAPERFGDVVLARKDAPASYHLAVVIDDAAQGVTDIVRGADLFDATHVHRLLQALLGLPTPRYHHHPLLTGPDGRRLAKRDGAPPLADLRAAGADPAEILGNLRARGFPEGLTHPT
ncbi:tRNA glutamyl-Q(34) synthetase GluQRS [Sphingomonas jatrophae]|uniref:Glutamyl-Q tRNA(Asp) synthetase n=1 Tax=Sphingomonas jatrophae TaxID=1166337 RepID=A0A1I6LRD7_9SPHN|nr:tRNA glutamyl-Q(34) synthetase GluQRS [Sphingomonas jatrophae]SFS06021.1 glutamyl-Q tRNA(Asp) synthetase [Sphingomonas jatrophae]